MQNWWTNEHLLWEKWEREKFQPMRLWPRFAEAPTRDTQTQGPELCPQLQNCCHGRETWNITSWKENTHSGCHLNVIIQPRLSIHPPESAVCERAEAHGVVQNVCSYDCSQLPSGSSQILNDIWALLSGAHWLKQRRKAGNIKAGSDTYSHLITQNCRRHHKYSCSFYSWWSSLAAFTLSSAISIYHVL